MMASRRKNGEDLRGANRLVMDAFLGVTEVVQAMHLTIAGGPRTLGRPFARWIRLWTNPVYGAVKRVGRGVGTGADFLLGRYAPLLGTSVPGPRREALLSALNGVLGDYLSDTHNPLALQMRFRYQGRPLRLEAPALRASLPRVTGKVLVLVHGSSMNDRQWSRNGHDHGQALGARLGFSPLYLHYNSGLHISTNGQRLAALLEQLVARWPVPIEQLVLLGHSMGGLVARSACHAGEVASHAWRRALSQLIFLGTPHQGTALEYAGCCFHELLGLSRYSHPLARLGRLRSAGVTDLRFGNVLDAHWAGRDRFALGADPRCPLPLPADVDCRAIAATRTPDASVPPRGDGLVSVASALGKSPKAGLSLRFAQGNTWIAYGTDHLSLLDQPQVFEQLVSWLARRPRLLRR